MTSDPEALRALHRAHAAPLWAYVVHLTGDRARAEDVVQETMLRAWRHGITDAPRTGDVGEQDEAVTESTRTSSARAWLFTVARHLVIDETRSARARHESTTDLPPDGTVGDQVDALFESLLVTDALDRKSVV